MFFKTIEVTTFPTSDFNSQIRSRSSRTKAKCYKKYKRQTGFFSESHSLAIIKESGIDTVSLKATLVNLIEVFQKHMVFLRAIIIFF